MQDIITIVYESGLHKRTVLSDLDLNMILKTNKKSYVFKVSIPDELLYLHLAGQLEPVDPDKIVQNVLDKLKLVGTDADSHGGEVTMS